MARPSLPPGLAPAALGLLLAGCFYPADRGRLLEMQVDRISVQNELLDRKLTDADQKLSGTLPRVEEKLGQMTKALESLDKAARRSDADIGVQLQKAMEDMQQLRGQVETYLHRIDALDQGLKQLQQDLDKKLADLQSAQGAEAARQAEVQRRAEQLKRPDTPKEMLELADEKARSGDLPLARRLYAELLKKWPKHELTAQTEFGLAEAYFAESKCEDALAHYEIVLKEYDKSPSAPNALLHTSECFRKLKMIDASREALLELVKKHPRSDAAKTAKTRLAELDKAANPKKGGKK